ncbi:DUF3667 domain-containing protein [Cellulophaga fucicola]|uniref:DUF3667 domain-containing protein n=1 Tax=Cellulophaga fucicola TaxID=76595 RepID=UPI003EB943BD
MNKELRDNVERNSKLNRIDKKYLYNEIKGLLNLEKGLFLTIKNLLIKPGKSVREFLFENRKKYVKPIIFLIFTSLFFSLIISLLDVNFSLFNIDKIEGLKGKLRSKEIGDWSQNNLGYSQLIMGVFIAFWIKLFYRKTNYNIYEIFILLSFVLGESFIILGVFILLASILNSAIIGLIGTLVYFIYIIWAIGQFFGEYKIKNYLKSFFAYALGNITYLMIMALVAFLLKFI